MHNFSKIYSAALDGIDAKLIEVEVDINVGLHAFNIVGLADKALTEAKDRVNAAIKNAGAKPPNKENRKITVNLAPADIKKTGSHYDLAIAVGYLLATKQIKNFVTDDKIFVGELSLDGKLRPINGALNIAELVKKIGYRHLILPKENASEASVISGLMVIPAENMTQVINYLEGREEILPAEYQVKKIKKDDFPVDFSNIKGQENAKRALAIAAAGGHNLLMVGPPGAGKSLMAKAMISILPDLEINEAIEITKIYSAAGLTRGGLLETRPFRSPHHNASLVAVTGGGTNPKPGEISLAHRGILFLDELPEFRRDILESLRQPLEDGKIHIARAKNSLELPAKFTLVAAMNPCPCGYFGDREHECRCSANEVFRYQKKISGPLLDRIDLQINVPRINIEELRRDRAGDKNKKNRDSSEKTRALVEKARDFARLRFKKNHLNIFTNAEMSSAECDKFIELDESSEHFLKSALENTFISARGYYRILKTATTIADLEGSGIIKKEHLQEAFGYRLRQKE